VGSPQGEVDASGEVTADWSWLEPRADGGGWLPPVPEANLPATVQRRRAAIESLSRAERAVLACLRWWRAGAPAAVIARDAALRVDEAQGVLETLAVADVDRWSDVLDENMRGVWPTVATAIAGTDGLLMGGTAVAVHLRHRTSDDLDVMTLRPFPAGSIGSKPWRTTSRPSLVRYKSLTANRGATGAMDQRRRRMRRRRGGAIGADAVATVPESTASASAGLKGGALEDCTGSGSWETTPVTPGTRCRRTASMPAVRVTIDSGQVRQAPIISTSTTPSSLTPTSVRSPPSDCSAGRTKSSISFSRSMSTALAMAQNTSIQVPAPASSASS